MPEEVVDTDVDVDGDEGEGGTVVVGFVVDGAPVVNGPFVGKPAVGGTLAVGVVAGGAPVFCAVKMLKESRKTLKYI